MSNESTPSPQASMPSACPMALPGTGGQFHGRRVRGAENNVSSPLFQGRFGRMFRTLPPAAFGPDAIDKLSQAMVADPDPPTPETESDDEENSGIFAGYTYLGQFLDHDLTFDPASSLERRNDPNALVDFRTPRFDLDSLYGRGPEDQPYLYRDDGMHLLQGRILSGNDDPLARDLPRNTPAGSEPARALIGDPRNDENVIVSQLHGMMTRFHNRLVDLALPGDPSSKFFRIQQEVRWHYQWVILHDFLPTIAGQDVVFSVLPHLKTGRSIHADPPRLHFFHWTNDPFIPVEFSAAAYRFGHSMVRPIYRLNQTIPRFPIFSSDPNTSLTGFRAFPSNWAIDWSLFFRLKDSSPDLGPERLQRAYKIDSSIVNPLGDLPGTVARPAPGTITNPPRASLAELNLKRGLSMGLPSGQAVARYMHLPVIADADLKVGKANEDGAKSNPTLASLSPSLKGNAPLWYYVLAEAQQQFKDNSTPIRLGPVGGRIVTEVFVGLLLGDPHSFLSLEPGWTPRAEFTNHGVFGFAELLKQAQMV